MDITKVVARMRLLFHAIMLDVNNVLNQLGIRNDNKAEDCGRKHTMIIINDILPILGYRIEKYRRNW